MSKTLSLFFVLLAAVFVAPFTVHAQQATLSFVPTSQTVAQGSTFTVQIFSNTGTQLVNAVGAYFSYPVDKLDVVQVTTTGSVLQFVAESTGTQGIVRIAGGKPTPGFSGSQLIGQVQFRAKASSGSATLSWNPDSAILTDQGNQNILSIASSPSAVFQLTAGGTTPPPPPTTPTPTPPPPPPGGPTPAPFPEPAPVIEEDIFNISVKRLSSGEYLLSWETRELAKTSVFYGPAPLGSQESAPFSVIDSAASLEHIAVLSRAEVDYEVMIVAMSEGQGGTSMSEVFTISELLAGGGGPAPSPSPTPSASGEQGFEVAGINVPFSPLYLALGLGGLVILLIIFLMLARRG